jgi:hypothetical protein
MILQLINEAINANIGAKTKIILLLFAGIINSLLISLTASAIGCNTPQNPTTFGPFRRCTDAISLRSTNV